jgi:hypothetical protein
VRFTPTATIHLAKSDGTREPSRAEVFGEWAVHPPASHPSMLFAPGIYSVSHVPTGRLFLRVLSLRSARKVAGATRRRVPKHPRNARHAQPSGN